MLTRSRTSSEKLSIWNDTLTLPCMEKNIQVSKPVLRYCFECFGSLSGLLEHCLDTVRQSIQCYGSATLIPTRWFDSLGHPYVDTDQIHTCRDIRVLREWANERSYPQQRNSIIIWRTTEPLSSISRQTLPQWIELMVSQNLSLMCKCAARFEKHIQTSLYQS